MYCCIRFIGIISLKDGHHKIFSDLLKIESVTEYVGHVVLQLEATVYLEVEVVKYSLETGS